MDIYVLHGNKLDATWDIPDSVKVDILGSHLDIYDGDELIDTLSGSVGLGIDSEHKVNAYIGDTSFLPIKTLLFKLFIRSMSGEYDLYDSGSIHVVKSSNIGATKEARPWDLLNPRIDHVSRQERRARLDVCHQCPRLQAGICMECGCIVNLKTKLPHAQCPLHKW